MLEDVQDTHIYPDNKSGSTHNSDVARLHEGHRQRHISVFGCQLGSKFRLVSTILWHNENTSRPQHSPERTERRWRPSVGWLHSLPRDTDTIFMVAWNPPPSLSLLHCPSFTVPPSQSLLHWHQRHSQELVSLLICLSSILFCTLIRRPDSSSVKVKRIFIPCNFSPKFFFIIDWAIEETT